LPGEGVRRGPEAFEYRLQALPFVRVAWRHLDARAANLGLEVLRPPLGDDPAGVDDPDTVR
jgi:hypothetical protein